MLSLSGLCFPGYAASIDIVAAVSLVLFIAAVVVALVSLNKFPPSSPLLGSIPLHCFSQIQVDHPLFSYLCLLFRG
jgi:hypothetical protein